MSGRYASVSVRTTIVTGPGGAPQPVRYLGRRPLPTTPAGHLVGVHHVVRGDRLDLIAAAQLGDPLAAWQIADANLALDPFALVSDDAEGDALRIPFPAAAP